MRVRILMLPLILIGACTPPVFRSKWIKEQSPEEFTARFETSKGDFDVAFTRKSSPLAVDRMYQLLLHHFYDNAIFYRGVSNFVIQFGISDTVKNYRWSKYKVPDEPVLDGNKKGTITFATAGKDSRGSEVFINLKDNPKLDTIVLDGVKGFPALGAVTHHFEVVQSIYTGYDDSTMTQLDTMYLNRRYFLSKFPKLDSIRRAYILK